MSPLSRRPEARARQLANLRKPQAPPPGNQRAATHRGYAEVTDAERDERTRTIFEALSADAPLREGGELPAADAMVVHLLARCLVRLERLEEFHATYGAFDLKSKTPRPSLDLERRLRAEALDYARELGMTPRSRAALGLDLRRGMDLARAAAADWEAEAGEGDGGG